LTNHGWVYLVRQRADLLRHIQDANSQYKLREFGRKIVHKVHCVGSAEQFPDPVVRRSIEIDLELIDHYDRLISELETYLQHHARLHDLQALYLLRTVHGIGAALSLVILCEIQDIRRLPTVGDFVSWTRLVKCVMESAGKRLGSSGGKIGNAHPKWAFSEAASLFLRANPEGMRHGQRLEHKHDKAKALSIIAHRLGRTVCSMLLRQRAFDMQKFLAS